MANGTDSDEFVVRSTVRTGLKREFEFACKSQAEISGTTLGRTRSEKRRSVTGATSPEPRGVSDEPPIEVNDRSEESNETGIRRFSGEERKGDDFERNIVNELGGEKMSCGASPTCVYPEQVLRSASNSSEMVLKNAKPFVAPKVQSASYRRATGKKFPSKLKEVLDSRILEGLNVRYIKGQKARGSGNMGLGGVVKGSGILCHCNSCNGTEIVTPTVFELHAGSSNKRPPEYIYLDNGNTLRDVINACQNSSLAELEVTLQTAIGVSVIKNCSMCLNCKGSLSEAGTGKSTIFCDSCVNLTESQTERVEIADLSNSFVSPKSFFTPKLSNSEPKSNSSLSKSQGRITRKDNRLHKLVFAEDILPDGTQVTYFSRGQKTLAGIKMGSGIICSCCNSELSPSQFEAHAGWASRRKPYLHIYTSNGVSLHELSLALARDPNFSTSIKDNLCFVCQGEGDLFCCNGCPRAFHARCLNLPTNPGGVWYCKLCPNLFDKEKFVGNNINAVAAGRVAGVNSIEQIANRCIRIMKTEDIAFGGCALCKGHDFSKSGFNSLTVLFCDQCEKEFHVGCLNTHGLEDLKELPEGMWFCCPDCKNINHCLERYTLRGPKKLPQNLINLIKKKQNEDGSESSSSELDVKWRLVNRNVASNEETELLLSKSVAIFRDRFTPITDPATGRDLIPEMLYGNSFMGQDFSRMYCAVLTVNEIVVSAGIFRIYGSEVSELPLVATNTEYQGQGYFMVWMTCFQKFLSFMNVRNLVLPAAMEAESIWTKKFGFCKVDTDRLNEYKRQHQMMIFQGTTVLWKSVPKRKAVEKK